MTLPNFLIIGAAKAGTTSLYNYLEQHPDVFMSPDKEPRFFAFKGDTSGNYPYTELHQYEKLFNGVTTEKMAGEASTFYLYSKSAPDCIKEHAPDVKLVAVLRNPIDRAYSQFVYWQREGKEVETDFAKIVNEELDNMQAENSDSYIMRGMYGSQLQRYFDIFPKEQIRVYLFEDLCERPEEMLKDVFGFLNIDDTFKVNFSKNYNVSTMPQSGIKQVIYAFIMRQNRLKATLMKILPNNIYWKYIAPLARTLANALRSRKKLAVRPLDNVIRQQLIDVYRDDIQLTEKLINRDLQSWLR